MSHETDDSNPLAGVDLRAWTPPAPPAGQVDAILARLDGTRTDAAAAVEATSPRRSPRRVPWIAAGLLIGAAVAAAVAFAVQTEAAQPTAAPPVIPSTGGTVRAPVPAPTPAPPPAPAPAPAPTPAPAPAALPDHTVDHTPRPAPEPEPDIEIDTPACNATALLDEARAAGAANQWKAMQAKAAASDTCSPSRMARQFEILAACRLGDTDAAERLWPEFQNNAQLQQACVGVLDDPCQSDKLLDEARAAGRNHKWSVMLTQARKSNECRASETARKLALLAACRLGQKAVAQGYWKEFEHDTAIQQVCVGVID